MKDILAQKILIFFPNVPFHTFSRIVDWSLGYEPYSLGSLKVKKLYENFEKENLYRKKLTWKLSSF